MAVQFLFWGLVALAVVSVILFISRWFALRRAQIDWQDFNKGIINILESGNDAEALAVCDDTMAPVAMVVASAIRNRACTPSALHDAVDAQGRAEVGRLERRLAFLSVLSHTAPLVGLLGTVLGFINVVKLVNTQDLVTRPQILEACMHPLTVAAVGLSAAILSAILLAVLRVRLDRLIVEIEAAASQIVGYLTTPKEVHHA